MPSCGSGGIDAFSSANSASTGPSRLHDRATRTGRHGITGEAASLASVAERALQGALRGTDQEHRVTGPCSPCRTLWITVGALAGWEVRLPNTETGAKAWLQRLRIGPEAGRKKSQIANPVV